MAEWMTVRVALVSGRGTDFDPPPGRVFLVGPSHTFGEFADAINLHFARWDLSHLHDFRLADGSEIGFPVASDTRFLENVPRIVHQWQHASWQA